MNSIHEIAAISFGLTATLLLIIEFVPNKTAKRIAAVLALLGVGVADFYLLADVPEMGPLFTDDGMRSPRRAPPQQAAADEDDDEDGQAEVKEATGGRSRVRRLESDIDNSTLKKVAAWLINEPVKSAQSPHPAGQVFRDCPDCPELIVIGAGESHIGADDNDILATAAELPQRTVRVWPGFAMGRVEVTAYEWASYLRETGTLPSTCGPHVQKATFTGREAASCVTWDAAMSYVAWLGHRTGKRYRLPTAAEWEYAARRPQDQVPADMAGGVAELTVDCWSSSIPEETSGRVVLPAHGCAHHVVKDGASGENARWHRPSARRAVAQEAASATIGFRVLRELE